MIMPIAIAKHGFVNYTSFLENFSLEEILRRLNFENKDLQDFDGNTCKLVNNYDPTNSIFIYENQQGRFLYTITSATPLIHKNKKIWLCNCFEMEDLNEYENLVKSYETTKYSNLIFFKGNYTTMLVDPLKVKIKDNFKAMQKYKVPFMQSYTDNYFTLKIKCTTNPTTETLETKAPDGSFNFLFPIRIEEADENKVNSFTTKIKDVFNDSETISLYDVISKYLPNIKSIEVLPFKVPSLVLDVARGNDYVDVGGGKFTDCGVFMPINYSTEYFSLDVDLPKLPSFDVKELIVGGGIRGFLQTPLGNIELQFNSDLFDTLAPARVLIKEDGWKIDGKFKCEVAPHYLDFYTDNAGQIFIQNLTTNAQELRRINNEKIFREETNQQNFINSTIKSGFGVISNLATGNYAGALGRVGDILNQGATTQFNKIEIEREYNKSIAEFKDKQKTESLLASMTGKELTGQFSIIDFLQFVNNRFFCLYFETNFIKDPRGNFICQDDYDYSIDIEEITYEPNYDFSVTQKQNNINYLLSFRKVVILENLNQQIEVRNSQTINLFLRNSISRL